MKRNLINVIKINQEGTDTMSMTIIDKKELFENTCLLNDNDTIATYCKQYMETLKFIEDNKELEKWCTLRFDLNANYWGKRQNNEELLSAKNKLYESILKDIHFEDEDKEYDFDCENNIGGEDDYEVYCNTWILEDIKNMIKDFFYGLQSGNLALNN